MSTPAETPTMTVPDECANCGKNAGADPQFCGDCARPLCAECVAEIREGGLDPDTGEDLLCDDCLDEYDDELDDEEEEDDDDDSDDDEDDDTD